MTGIKNLLKSKSKSERIWIWFGFDLRAKIQYTAYKWNKFGVDSKDQIWSAYQKNKLSNGNYYIMARQNKSLSISDILNFLIK